MKQEFEKEGMWYLGEGDSVLFFGARIFAFFQPQRHDFDTYKGVL
jgi:hypothetical protein